MSTLAEYGYVCEALAARKGLEIVGLGLGETGSLTDVFILVTGNSEVHMKTLVDAAREALERQGHSVRVEGENSTNWRLIDAGDVAVHVFSRKGRDFYRLEKLWGDAETLSYEYKE
ncbi:MAG: ribosome silencing factor [Synergistaceae bacterium]|jgi:ribosome-associated protein|nr:ribosome silencing factor [Synergistaceae bacterium]